MRSRGGSTRATSVFLPDGPHELTEHDGRVAAGAELELQNHRNLLSIAVVVAAASGTAWGKCGDGIVRELLELGDREGGLGWLILRRGIRKFPHRGLQPLEAGGRRRAKSRRVRKETSRLSLRRRSR